MKFGLICAIAFRGWVLLFPFFIVFSYFPIINFPIRVAAWAVGILILIGSIYFTRKLRVVPFALAAIYTGVILFISLVPAAKTTDVPGLRNAYCNALQSYMGCRYIWGGETYFSVDCSGFVRKALEDAFVEQGIYEGDPGLIRSAIWLYWNDTTARVLGAGYFGQTVLIKTAIDYSLLKPGDLVVLDNGTHVIAYLGNKVWIAADPTANKVIEFRMPDDSSARRPVSVRWKILQPPT